MYSERFLKAQATMKAKLLQIITDNPGVQGNSELIPLHLRRFFRELQRDDGKIEYRDGWYVVEGK